MSKVTIALSTIAKDLPAGKTTAGTRRFSIMNPVDSSVVQAIDSSDVTVSFTGVPELDLVASVQTVGTDGLLFDDLIASPFNGTPPVVAPATYVAPATLSVLVEAE